jgi:REP element-mobilizing transposase RayT
MSDIQYRRNLPHIHPHGYPLFITFRLANSLPGEVVLNLKKQREEELRTAKKSVLELQEIEKRYFNRYDEWLDNCGTGPRWLEHEDVAQVVNEKILELKNNRYELIAYCIMPNHCHLLIENLVMETAQHHGSAAKYPVSDTLRFLKGSTARHCNQILGRSGQFWHDESYDHYVRTQAELERTILYILHNPMKACLVKEWTDWKFNYVNPKYGVW